MVSISDTMFAASFSGVHSDNKKAIKEAIKDERNNCSHGKQNGVACELIVPTKILLPDVRSLCWTEYRKEENGRFSLMYDLQSMRTDCPTKQSTDDTMVQSL